eukprot:2765774-Ditylum_brightwellii.AAC.1
MSKHPNEMVLIYLNRFTISVIKLRNAVSTRGAIQTPPNHMLAYYLINGLQFPKEDFLPILSDLKKNNRNASDYVNSTGDLAYTLCKALEHAQSCREIKGTLVPKTPTKKQHVQQPHTPAPEKLSNPHWENPSNPHWEKFTMDVKKANSREGKIQVIRKYHQESEPGGCSVHPGTRTYTFPHC